jgi:dTMP kinase
LLDVSVKESARRTKGRERATGQEQDRFELEKEEFHQRVRDGYLRLAKRDASQWLVLSAELKPAAVFTGLLEHLKAKKWLI